MANSRKSTRLNKSTVRLVEQAFERALEAILARVVFSAGDSIAVAYSGGLDSSVLLHLAAQYCRAHQITLYAFHVHHGLSPNADDWLVHARERCAELQVNFDSRRVSVAHISEQGTEQAARLARYAALGEMCQAHQVRLLLTAHHEDDQAETVMLQWLRGAGLPGLSGMAAHQQQHALLPSSVTLGRPLLALSRSALEQLADAFQLSHVIDESNNDVRYRRNALRHQVFPVIGQHFEGFASTLARSSRHVQAAQRLLTELAKDDLKRCEQEGVLLIDRLTGMSTERIDHLLRHWVQARTGQYPSEVQLQQLQRQMLRSATDAQPVVKMHGWMIERQRHLLVIRRATRSSQPPVQPISLSWHGEQHIALPEWQGRLVFTLGDGIGVNPELLRSGPLLLRARVGGERVQLHPKRPSRTLKNLFQESCVPASQRAWLPLLYLGQRLVFAAGLGMDARFDLSEGGVVLTWESIVPA